MNDLEQLLKDLKTDTVPSLTFRQNARVRILNTVTTPHPLRMSWYRKPRVWGYTFGTAIATVTLSVGTVFAAQSSLPNSALYPVKVLSEQVALTLSPTSFKTAVASTIISRRVEEIEKVQKQGNKKELDQSIANFDEDVATLKKHEGISRSVIENTIAQHEKYVNSLRKGHKDEKPEDQSRGSEDTQPTPPAPTTAQTEIKLPDVKGDSIIRREDD